MNSTDSNFNCDFAAFTFPKDQRYVRVENKVFKLISNFVIDENVITDAEKVNYRLFTSISEKNIFFVIL